MHPHRLMSIPAALAATLIGPRTATAEPIDGSFLAVRGCPAYVSKNKLTNPDNQRITPGQTYAVIERNTADHPSHYRIVLATANPRERWVGSDCGTFSNGAAPTPGPGPAPAPSPTPQPTPTPTPTPGPTPAPTPGGADESTSHCPVPQPGTRSCNTCGRDDSYVLAMSWQPAFCQSKKSNLSDKPECTNTDPRSFMANNFTLHGLWPNQNSCGHNYQFCGDVHGPESSFKNYPAVPISATTRQTLAGVMPSVAAGSGLERHEWYKHGTCSGYLPDTYFNKAVALAQQFNASGLASYMTANLGKKISKREFFDQIDKALGRGARDRVNLDCGQGTKWLMGVEVQLPKVLTPGADLKALVAKAPTVVPSNQCPDSFLIDPIGF
jgi:ribonuclease T2